MASTDDYLATVVDRARLLVVEDDPDMAENLAEVLSELGAVADIAHSAESALEQLGLHDYAGVITDQRLPGRAGVELIRDMRRSGIRTAVVMMSGFMDHQTELIAEEAGALEVLAKPVEIARLARIVQTFARERMDVLVVEDSHELAEDLAAALADLGLAPIVAHSGEEALAQRNLPRVAVVDIRLPDSNGLEVARRLMARDPGLTVMFLSGFAEEHADELGHINIPGSNTLMPCIPKPCNLGWLAQKVHHAAERR
ncbi:MAG: response regulator [Myxococcales bacterium]|nr:response regulator [Myxococcales bacterium]